MKLSSPVVRRLVLVVLYCGLLSACLYCAYQMRFDFEVPAEFLQRFWKTLIWIVPLKLALLVMTGQFRSMLSFFSLPDAKRLLQAMGSAVGVEFALWYATAGAMMPPRGVILSDFVLSFIALMALRTSLRVYRERFQFSTGQKPSSGLKRRRVVIIGAGAAGATLLMEILSKPGLGMEVACFLDDNPAKAGTTLHGRRIIGPRNLLSRVVEEESVTKAIIAMPSASPQVIKETVQQLNDLGLEHDILPSVTQLLHRSVTVSHLRHVEPEDLLGRSPVGLDHDGILNLVKGRVVLVTGAGGSIGSELCRQLAVRSPSKLVLVERSEPALYAIEQELIRDFCGVAIESLAVNVTHEPSVDRVFAAHRPELIFHAAAHKHVPMMERQPAEAILNNVFGSEIVARCAFRHRVSKCILVSTDKAVNPTNVMGATKRVAELVWGAYQKRSQMDTVGGCTYAAVRFGNVLGSSGSVIPAFKTQISQGGPVRVTHPEINRFFMSIPEAAGLILQSALLSAGGEIFVLDMGEPIRIQDLARQMIELCGFRPDEEIAIEYTGLRPGEKLYEEPVHQSEKVEPTSHPKVRLLRSAEVPEAQRIFEQLAEIGEKLTTEPKEALLEWLGEVVPEYAEAVV